MFKIIATNVVISHGYNGADALKFSDNGGSVRFRIGKKVYDPKAKDNVRWVNMSVKAFGNVCERIKKMQLKESSFINLEGRLDEEFWSDPNTHEEKSQFVIVLDDVEYASSGEGGKAKNKDVQNQNATAQPAAPVPQGDPVLHADSNNATAGSGFTGYEPFGSGSGFFDEG